VGLLDQMPTTSDKNQSRVLAADITNELISNDNIVEGPFEIESEENTNTEKAENRAPEVKV